MPEQDEQDLGPTTEYLIALDEILIRHFEDWLGPDLKDAARPADTLPPFEQYAATVRGLLDALKARLALRQILRRSGLDDIPLARLVVEMREAEDRVTGWAARMDAAAHRVKSRPKKKRRRPVWYGPAVVEFACHLRGAEEDEGKGLWLLSERGGVVEREDGTFRFRRVGEELEIAREEDGKKKRIRKRAFLRWAEGAQSGSAETAIALNRAGRAARWASFEERARMAKEEVKRLRASQPR